MVNMLRDYPRWNAQTCMDEMGHIIRDMVEFEKE